MGLKEFRAQVVAEEIRMDLVQRLAHLLGTDGERDPGVVTTGEMGALGARRAALAALTAGQLLEAAVQVLDLPAHVARCLSGLRGQRRVWSIGDDPVNVAVWGDHLE